MSTRKYKLLVVFLTAALVACGGAEERKAVYLEKAMKSMELGAYDKARIDLKNVLQIDPKNDRAYYQLGKIFESQEEYKKAYKNYTRAVEMAPDNLDYQAKMGNFLLIHAGDIDEAITRRDIVLGKDPAHIDGLLLKSGILFKQNDVISAKKISEDIFSKQPGHIANAHFLSSMYLLNKDYQSSIDILNKCLESNPSNRDLKEKLALSYLIAKQNDKAETIYRAILENHPDIFENHLKLAIFYKKINEVDKAESVLRKAFELDEEDDKRKLVYINFLRQAKGDQYAVKELEKLTIKFPFMGGLKLELARVYIALKNISSAEKTLESAISEFSDNAVGIKSRVLLISLHMQRKNFEEAARIIDEALEISPKDSEINFFKGKLEFINKDYASAIITLRTVVKEEHNIEAYIILATAHKIIGEEEQANDVIVRAYKNNRTDVKSLLTLVKYHDKNKDYAKLEKIINNILSIDPNNYLALTYKVSLLNKNKMYSDVPEYASRIIEFYPTLVNGYILSIPYLINDKKANEVITLLEEGYKKADDKQTVLEYLVTFLIMQDDTAAAKIRVQQALQDQGESAELYMLLAKAQQEDKKHSDAESSLYKAIALRPDWNQPYLVLSKIYIAGNNNQKAIEVLLKGLGQSSYDLNLSLSLSKIYEDTGAFKKAIAEYERLYATENNNVLVMNNLAALLTEHRADDKSLMLAKELADKLKNVNTPVILDTVGWVYYKTGDYAEAVVLLKKVVEKFPDIAVFNYHLGMALYESGDKTSAKIHLSKSLVIGDDFTGKEIAKSYLEKLKQIINNK